MRCLNNTEKLYLEKGSNKAGNTLFSVSNFLRYVMKLFVCATLKCKYELSPLQLKRKDLITEMLCFQITAVDVLPVKTTK